jgi:hypothetical protein
VMAGAGGRARSTKVRIEREFLIRER